MNVLFLSAYFAPEPNVIITDIANSCAKLSHTTAVATVHPNYPLGKFYDEVKSIWPKVTLSPSRVKITAMPTVPDHGQGIFKRALSYVCSTLAIGIAAPFTMLRPDIIFVYQTPFSMGLTALFYRLFSRAKIVFICVDLWPESFAASGIALPGFVTRLLYTYSVWINKRADHVVATTEGMRKRFLSDGQKPESVSYIPVWISAGSCDGRARAQVTDAGSNEYSTGSLKIVYAGNVGPAQQLEVIVEAARLLESQHAQVEFNIYGSGSEIERLVKMVEGFGLTTVKFHGRVTPAQAFEASRLADANLVHLRAADLFKYTVPSKLYSAFDAGRVVLCGAIGESADIVERSKGGFVFSPGSAQSLVQCIEKLTSISQDERKKLQNNAAHFFERNFRKELLIEKYLELINILIEKDTSSVGDRK